MNIPAGSYGRTLVLTINGETVSKVIEYPQLVITGIDDLTTQGGAAFIESNNALYAGLTATMMFGNTSLVLAEGGPGHLRTNSIPAGTGSVNVTISNNRTTSPIFVFKYQAPSINSMSASIDLKLTITGTSFGTDPNKFEVNGVNYTSVTIPVAHNKIVVQLAPGTQSSLVNITIDGLTSNSMMFVLKYPSVALVRISLPTTGGITTISGTGFGKEEDFTFVMGDLRIKPNYLFLTDRDNAVLSIPSGTGNVSCHVEVQALNTTNLPVTQYQYYSGLIGI
eukprot:gene20932-25129_t